MRTRIWADSAIGTEGKRRGMEERVCENGGETGSPQHSSNKLSDVVDTCGGTTDVFTVFMGDTHLAKDAC